MSFIFLYDHDADYDVDYYNFCKITTAKHMNGRTDKQSQNQTI